MRRLTCESCGAYLDVDTGSDVVKCPYCGAVYTLDEAGLVPVQKDTPHPAQPQGMAGKIVSKLLFLVALSPLIIGIGMGIYFVLPRLFPSLYKYVSHIRIYRVCAIDDLDGDGHSEYMLYGYEGVVGLLSSSTGKTEAVTNTGRDGLPDQITCAGRKAMGASNEDGSYTVYIPRRAGSRSEIITAKFETLDDIVATGAGQGCLAFEDKSKNVTFISINGSRIDSCDGAALQRVRYTPGNRYESRAVLSDGEITYSIKKTSKKFIVIQAQKGDKPLYTRRLKYKTLFINSIGAIARDGMLYLVVTHPEKSSRAITGRAVIVALDGRTGETVWTHEGDDSNTSPSLIHFEFEDGRVIAGIASEGIVSLDAKDGHVIWEYP